MNLQDMFNKYDDQKKLVKSDYDKMTEKRDIIINEIREDENVQSFDILNLGSYKLKTGVKYKDNDYDIDCGLFFANKNNLSANDLKNDVYEAIHNNRTKKFNTKCLSAKYQENGKGSFHLDFPIYFKDGDNFKLCDGKKDNVEFVNSEPRKLIDYLNYESLEEKLLKSYKRMVRLLKLWKSKVFSHSKVDSVPPSIAFNITARQYFENASSINDIDYLIDICAEIEKQFDDNDELLFLELPFSETSENVYYKILRDDDYVEQYREKLDAFKNGLIYARDCQSLDSACKELKKYFPDFPQPDKEKSNNNPRSNQGRYGY